MTPFCKSDSDLPLVRAGCASESPILGRVQSRVVGSLLPSQLAGEKLSFGHRLRGSVVMTLLEQSFLMRSHECE